MSELTDLYNEIKEIQKHWRAGKLKDAEADKELRFLKERAGVLKQMVAIAVHGYPGGGAHFRNHIDRTGITSPGETIPLLPQKIEYERLLCEHNGGEITRGECLEKEGSKETEHEECKGCELGIINKKLLCPPEQEHI